MKKLIEKSRNKGLLKIILSSLFEIFLIFMIYNVEEMSTFGSVVCFILWTIVALIYFIGGMNHIQNYKNNVNKYIKAPNYEELEEECKKAKKISSLYIGDKHVFVFTTTGFYILNISDIETMYYLHLGANPVKARPGYYYLFLKGEKIKEKIKIYFVSKNKVIEVMNYLKNINNNIIIK